MKRLKKIFIIIPLLTSFPLLLISQKANETYRQIFASSSAISQNIHSALDKLADDPSYNIAGDKIHNIEFITNLYQQNDYQPFWKELTYVEDGIDGIRMAYDDGLIPLDYHLEAILETVDVLTNNAGVTDDRIGMVSDLELLLTDGVIFYADHLLYGKTDPVSLLRTWNFGFAPIPELNPTTFLEYIENGQVALRLSELRPSLFMYDTLLSTLALYREIESRGGWQVIPTGGKIDPGTRDSRIPLIRERLAKTGELQVQDTSGGSLYDQNLEKDIRKFQATHGLEVDGVIGAGTFRELNTPVDDRIETIRVNLERIRWVAGNMPQSFLIVNIAAYWLTLMKDGKVIFKTNVVVGRPLDKTPVFRDRMRYIEFNPTWTVPTSIIKNEIIPKLRKNPKYLEDNHMVLLDSKGNEVSSSVLDMENLSASKFPYLVRQQPGPWNALGVVKFMFPNDYNVYLHDTPSKSLFNKAKRTYSHGCIRVQNPLDLAAALLQGTEWDRAKINKALETRETTRVILKPSVDVLLSYWTCGLNPEKELFFSDDPYDRDHDVLKELNKVMR